MFVVLCVLAVSAVVAVAAIGRAPQAAPIRVRARRAVWVVQRR